MRSCGGKEPSQNFHLDPNENERDLKTSSSVLAELYSASESGSGEEYFKCGGGGKAQRFLLDQLTPDLGDIVGINDIEKHEDGSISLYLWQRSTFYDKARIDMNTWQLRWFTFSSDWNVSSLPFRSENPLEQTTRASFLPLFDRIDVDESRLLLKIKTANRDYVLLSPSDPNFFTAVGKFEECLDFQVNNRVDNTVIADMQEAHSSLIVFPKDASASGVILYCITLPVKALIHFTVPDVRNGASVSPTAKAALAIIACMFSLIVGSYAMVNSLEELAHIFQIPDAVMGATVSAAGEFVN